ncbi:MAG: GNAT family N-acetyltransferase [Rhizobacter sp.]|nr:GNAT family N-acetyltransferase [Rhizobacter sp.]
MGSTDGARSAPIVALGQDDIADALALSASAHWNQNEADWRMMLAQGQGWGIRALRADGRETLAASTVVLPYGGSFAWISMVLVLPEFRRHGHATRLLRHALAVLDAKGLSAVLDATPAGKAVYSKEGFGEAWGFARYRREKRLPTAADVPSTHAPSADALGTRAMRDSDWPAIEAMDAPVFGADRSALLRSLARRLPQAARVVEKGALMRGFVLGRDGREASQIGPLLAEDTDAARNLIDGALRTIAGPVYLDLLDSQTALQPWLREQGFAQQRAFTRMVRGRHEAPGQADKIVLVAGPELG